MFNFIQILQKCVSRDCTDISVLYNIAVDVGSSTPSWWTPNQVESNTASTLWNLRESHKIHLFQSILPFCFVESEIFSIEKIITRRHWVIVFFPLIKTVSIYLEQFNLKLGMRKQGLYLFSFFVQVLFLLLFVCLFLLSDDFASSD